MISFDDTLQIVSLELFDAAFPVSRENEDEVRQRFMTLFAHDEGRHRGGSAEVRKVTNVLGETFALKRLRLTETQDEPEPPSTPVRKELRHSISGSNSGTSSTPDYVTAGHMAAFFEEYRIHLALSHLRGFPQLYGFGIAQGSPVIVMEWVKGTTLREALRERKSTEGDLLPLYVVSYLGSAVVELLQRACELDERFVHRDLSPRNIMLRTDHASAADQLSTGEFDLCLVDFGSATLHDPSSESPDFTAGTDIWRLGTPSYAPPEMLSADIALPANVRQSHTIDVYALCSVLYELYGGRQPFDLGPHDDRSPYRIKTEDKPALLTPREPDGGALALIIQTGLSIQQDDRPTLGQLAAALENWRGLPTQRSIGSLKGTKPADADYWQPDFARRTLTRRGLIAGTLVGCSALASLGIVLRKQIASRAGRLDPTRYVRADATYEGPPLYKVYDREFRAWALATDAGEIVCRPSSKRELGPLREGMFALYDDISQRWGFAVPAGDGGAAWKLLPAFAQVGIFSQGLAAAQDPSSKLWGYIDAEGTWEVPARFAAAGAFSCGAARVQDVDSLLWGAVDEQGGWLLRPTFRTLGTRAEDGFAIAEDTRGWGIVDADGSWTGATRLALLRRYRCELAPAYDTESELWGFVGADGSWAIEPRFAEARPFFPAEASGTAEALAAVQDATSKLWGFVGRDGEPHARKAPAYWKLGDLYDGLAPAQASDEDDVVVFDDDDPDGGATEAALRYGYVDAEGNWHLKQLTELTDTAIGPAEI